MVKDNNYLQIPLDSIHLDEKKKGMENRVTGVSKMSPMATMSKIETLNLILKLAFSLPPASSKNGQVQIIFKYIMCIMISIQNERSVEKGQRRQLFNPGIL